MKIIRANNNVMEMKPRYRDQTTIINVRLCRATELMFEIDGASKCCYCSQSPLSASTFLDSILVSWSAPAYRILWEIYLLYSLLRI